jgi:putative hydrolase of the HAD superfamily
VKPADQPSALVLDFGGPALLTPFELAEAADTPLRTLLADRGPFAPADRPDLAWNDLQAGRITERAYWNDVAAQWRNAGGGPDVRAMFSQLYAPPRPDLIRDEARLLVRDARRAGFLIAILTNDLQAFHGPAWVAQMDFVHDVDVLTDGSAEGVLKPDPRLYQITAERLGVDVAGMAFLDDQPTNIRGAEALGIQAVWLDVTDPATGYAAVRKLLNLKEESGHGCETRTPRDPDVLGS